MRTNSKSNGLTWLKQNVSAGWQRSAWPKNKDETHPPPRRAVYRPDMRASAAQCEVIAVDGDIAWAVWITGPGTPLGDPRFDHRSLQRTVCSQSIYMKQAHESQLCPCPEGACWGGAGGGGRPCTHHKFVG